MIFNSPYNPRVLICDRGRSNPSNMPEAKRGIYLPMITQKNNDGKFFIFVGFGGVTGKKATLCGNEDSRLKRVWERRVSPRMPKKISNWNKAILICDWVDDINPNLDEDSKVKAMKKDVINFRKVLIDELKKDGDSNFDVLNRRKFKFTRLKDESDHVRERYKGYVHMIKEAVKIIT